MMECGLIDESTVSETSSLRRSAENRAVLLPSVDKIDDHLFTLLACAFSLSEAGSPAIPYVPPPVMC